LDGFNQQFDGHRFCEAAPEKYLQEPIGKETWFWHSKSPSFIGGGEGLDLAKEVLNVLTPNQTRDGEPWTWSPFFDDKEIFYDGLTKMLSGRDSSAFPLSHYRSK
jgi:hypothetical protein